MSGEPVEREQAEARAAERQQRSEVPNGRAGRAALGGA